MQDIAIVAQSNAAVGLDVLYFYIFVHIHHVLAIWANLIEKERQCKQLCSRSVWPAKGSFCACEGSGMNFGDVPSLKLLASLNNFPSV